MRSNFISKYQSKFSIYDSKMQLFISWLLINRKLADVPLIVYGTFRLQWQPQLITFHVRHNFPLAFYMNATVGVWINRFYTNYNLLTTGNDWAYISYEHFWTAQLRRANLFMVWLEQLFKCTLTIASLVACLFTSIRSVYFFTPPFFGRNKVLTMFRAREDCTDLPGPTSNKQEFRYDNVIFLRTVRKENNYELAAHGKQQSTLVEMSR